MKCLSFTFPFISRPCFSMQSMSKFMAGSRQATELDKKRIRLKTKVRDMGKEASRKAGE